LKVRDILIGGLWALAFLLFSSPAAAQLTFTINSLGDEPDMDIGDGLCDSGMMLPFDSACTLRAAIQEANATSGHVVIQFDNNLPTDNFGWSVIETFTILPTITDRVTIDGSTHADYVEDSGQPRVVLRYSATGAPGASGLLFASGSARSTVRALSIEAFPNSGILLLGGGGFTIEQCTIGLAWLPQRLSTLGNEQVGIFVDNASAPGASNITILRDNVISFNGTTGIMISGGSEATIVQNNVIGLAPPTGTNSAFVPQPAAGNGQYGIHILPTAGPNNQIGFFGSNTISNNVEGEILVEADGQTLGANLIGMPHDFLVPANFEVSDFGRGAVALDVNSSNNTIGNIGIVNHIGNASAFGIRVGAFGDTVTDNYIGHVRIGTTPDGDVAGSPMGINVFNSNNTIIDSATVAYSESSNIVVVSGSGHEIIRSHLYGNAINGISISGQVTVGGREDNGNVIVDGNRGVLVQAAGPGIVEISHNRIGTDDSNADLGNQTGVLVLGPNNTVDVIDNVIGFNDTGIQLDNGSTETWIQGNSIGRSSLGPVGISMPNGTGIRIRSSGDPVLNHRIGYGPTDMIPDKLLLANFIISSGAAIEFTGDSDALVVGHSIRGNQMLGNEQGIDLGPGGEITDPGDADEGPNRLQNVPEFDAALTELNADTGEIDYRFRVLTATDNAAYPLRVDFYSSFGDNLQGEIFLKTVVYPSAQAEQWVSGTLEPRVPVVPGGKLVATATDSQGNTSQFSPQSIPLGLLDFIFWDRFQLPEI
jgi:CSLREA domain-containing protein